MERWWVKAFLLNRMLPFCIKAIKRQEENIRLIIWENKKTQGLPSKQGKKNTTHIPTTLKKGNIF